MKVLTVLCAGAMCASATGDVPSSGMPPERYQGQGAGYVVFADDVGDFCGDAPESMVILACTKQHPQLGNVLILPNPCGFDEEVFARLACHEKAHAMGWSSMHED